MPVINLTPYLGMSSGNKIKHKHVTADKNVYVEVCDVKSGYQIVYAQVTSYKNYFLAIVLLDGKTIDLTPNKTYGKTYTTDHVAYTNYKIENDKIYICQTEVSGDADIDIFYTE